MMKNILKIMFSLALFLSINIKAQLETLNYVKQFEINKASYIGQPFSQLLADMTQIRPKTVNSLSKVWGKNLTPYSIFDFSAREKQYGRATVAIYIIWQNPLIHSQAFLLSKQNHFNFTSAEEAFYGDKIVADIKVSKL